MSEGGSTVTFLLRRKDTFDNDQAIKPFIKSGHVKLVIGDALSRDDVARAWKSAIEANETGVVDLVLSSNRCVPRYPIHPFPGSELIYCLHGQVQLLQASA